MSTMFPFGVGAFFLQNGRDGEYTRLGLAALQEVTINIDMEIKQLYGLNRFPVDARTGKGKIEGTAKFADWRLDMWELITQTESVAGQRFVKLARGDIDSTGAATGDAQTIDGSSQVKLLPLDDTTHNAITNAEWAGDIEVFFVDKGKGSSSLNKGDKLIQDASGTPAAGHYTVAAGTSGDAGKGVYQFATDEANAIVLINHFYTLSTDPGYTNQWLNVPIGSTPTCRGVFRGQHNELQLVLELDYVVPSSWKTGSKIDDWMFVDVAFQAFADPDSQSLGTLSLPQ